MTDDPILRTPGELLAEAREASGLPLAVISERTKIPVPQLQAVERDEYHRLSGPLYVKSFLRSYAEVVGADVDTVLDLYRRATGEGAAHVTEGKTEVWERETVTISRIGVDWGRLLLWGGGGAAVVVGVWLGVSLWIGGGDDKAPPSGSRTAAAARESLLSGALVQEPDTSGAELPADSLGFGGLVPAAGDAARTEAAPELPRAGGELPPALAGSGPIPFADGGRWPVRVRLLVTAPLAAQARCDGDPDFRAADFSGGNATPLPVRGIEAGRVYAVREGLVVYWHAADHVGLTLDRTDGVILTVNGEVRDVSGLRPGQEIILDAHR